MGYEYLITFTNYYSKFGYVYLMHKKFDALDKFIEFKAKLENQLGKHIKVLQSDWGGKYMSTQFIFFIKEHGIISQLNIPKTPQQNRIVKIRNRILIDIVRSVMSFSSLPISFWGDVLDTMTYLINLVSSKSIPLTFIEMWKGRKPSLQHIHICGCSTHVLKPNVDKLIGSKVWGMSICKLSKRNKRVLFL